MSNDQSTLGRILIADDEEPIRRLLDYNLRKEGYEPVLATNGREAISLLRESFAFALVDLKMPEEDGLSVLHQCKKRHPEMPVIIMSAVGQIRDVVAAIKQGAFDYITKPFQLDQLSAVTASAAQLGRALRENRSLKDSVGLPTPEEEFAGTSSHVQRLRHLITTIGPLDSTVLITGETGVGKGLLARMIHRASRRKSHPFIMASCPALPKELLESEMFGHEKGAFTGAFQRRLGRIEMARGGTLFLDEIGDLPLSLQPKFLNVLQDRHFQRVGGAEMIQADIRVVAATNVDLLEKVAAKEFREDLFYRLNVIQVVVPPLRERMEDLPVLAASFLRTIASRDGGSPIEVSPEAMQRLQRYSWPGNIRELHNVLERGAAFCRGRRIESDDIPQAMVQRSPVEGGGGAPGSSEPAVGGRPLEELEKLAIIQTLALCGGNKAETARRLGITERSIYNKMSRHGLR